MNDKVSASELDNAYRLLNAMAQGYFCGLRKALADPEAARRILAASETLERKRDTNDLT